ncbi:unnamed protein product [Eretmochelys imbricata]
MNQGDRNQAVQEWGDWAFQILVMMEMSSQPGGVYTWQVEHISLQRPLLLGAESRDVTKGRRGWA